VLSHSVIERSLWLLFIVLSLGLAARLLALKLAQNYRFFLTYLFFDSSRAVVMWFFRLGSVTYRDLWLVTEPVIWALYVLVVLELCTVALKGYRGIQALGRWTIFGSLVFSVFLSLMTVAPTWGRSRESASKLSRYLMVERGIDFALVLLVLVLLAFLTLFPIQLSKNVIIHCVLYSIFFISNTIGILIANLTGYQLNSTVSDSLMGVADLCLIGWLILMSREGEEKIMAFRPPIPAVDESRLIEQLANINATLLRASKRV